MLIGAVNARPIIWTIGLGALSIFGLRTGFSGERYR